MVEAACFESRISRARTPLCPQSFKGTQFPRWFAKIQYCGEPPWPRGSVLGLRPPGLEFRVPCLEDRFTSFIFRMFSCPGLAYKSGLKPYSFNFDTIHLSWAFNLVFWSWGEIMFYVSQLASPSDGPILVQCWLNVGPASWTVDQHWANFASSSCACWDITSLLLQLWQKHKFVYSKIRINICL